MVLALIGIGTAFRASYQLIPSMERDSGHLVWSAFKTQREFDELRLHIEIFELTEDRGYLDQASLWLDVLYSRLSTFEHGKWASMEDNAKQSGEFTHRLRENLSKIDTILTSETLDGSSLSSLHQILFDSGSLIDKFLRDNQEMRQIASDDRKAKTEQLIDYQIFLLVAVLFSIGVLFGLFGFRTRQAVWLASHDLLTKLTNRSAIIDALQRQTRTSVGNPDIAILCIDLDRFKSVNDTLGHSFGDKILDRVARRLEAIAGDGSIVARTGGNQFVILQQEVDDHGLAMHLAHKIIFSASNAFFVGDHQLRLGISIGVAASTEDTEVNAKLFDRADLALYEAKRRGGNTAVLFDPQLEERANRLRRIDTDLRKALDRCELVNFYQPKIDLATRKVVGAEALLRWIHPEHGMIRPDHFIPIAEDTRLIIPIGAWAANQACKDAKDWISACDGKFHIAVNLSPVQFESDMLVSEMRRALKSSGVEPHQLELEITESTLMEKNRNVEVTVRRLRDIGVRFALDDFGTGYSSLSYLDRFRFDKVKIDRTFVKDLDPALSRSPIIEAVVHMASGLGFEVCAEGIEDNELAQLLYKLGCNEAQGFYFGKPMPASEFTEYLHNQLEQSPASTTEVDAALQPEPPKTAEQGMAVIPA